MRLLNRTIIHYLIYAVVVVLVSIPAFYFVIDGLFTADVDETLLLRKQEVQFRIKDIRSEEDIRLWEKLDGDIRLSVTDRAVQDSIYSIIHYDSLANEMEPYRVLSSSILIHNKAYHLILRISLVESDDLITAIVFAQVVLLIILLSGLIIINGMVSKRIWKPFYSTLDKLKQFEMDKNPVIQLDRSLVKEFEDLNRAIMQLADKNYQVYLHQKEFTENASHEMQTPLAVFQAKLDLLLQSQLSAEQAMLIQSLLDATTRLNRLNRSLLLLAKIDNHQFIETEPVEITGFTLQLLAQFNDQIQRKRLHLQTHCEERITITFNKALLEILFSNLIANAIRHNIEGGDVEITIRKAAWTISNSGPALSISREKIFDRFQKGNQHPSSLGLGLAIVKRIGDNTGLRITYDFAENRHILTVLL